MIKLPFMIFFFYLFLVALWLMWFPGQWSDPSHSCELCGNTGSCKPMVLDRGLNLSPGAAETPWMPLHHSMNSPSWEHCDMIVMRMDFRGIQVWVRILPPKSSLQDLASLSPMLIGKMKVIIPIYIDCCLNWIIYTIQGFNSIVITCFICIYQINEGSIKKLF